MTSPAANPLLAAALAYALRGWAVFPLHSIIDGKCSCGKACGSHGKHPRTPNGLKDATVIEETISRWWQRWPGANIGLLTGARSGFWVLDVDAGADKPGEERPDQVGSTVFRRLRQHRPVFPLFLHDCGCRRNVPGHDWRGSLSAHPAVGAGQSLNEWARQKLLAAAAKVA